MPNPVHSMNINEWKGRIRMGLGKERTRFGEWVDKTFGYGGQTKIMKICGIDKSTASSVCSGDRHPNQSTRGRIVQALRQAGYKVREDDFWE